MNPNSPLLPVEIKELLTSAQVFHYRLVPIKKHKDFTEFITDRKIDERLKKELNIVLGFNVDLKAVSTKEFDQYAFRNYQKESSLHTKVLQDSDDLLDTILATARNIKSSDIHIEVYKNRARVRLRLDGKLKEFFTIPISRYPIIINKIKVKAQLDISEKRLPQDGRISIKEGGQEIDIRVSILPSLYGEKVVLRILSRAATQIKLEQLGFSSKDIEGYEKVMTAPQGIILISGPTGSGKTTTLYATLKEINTESKNIVTIEDPIEYTLDGINQVQLNEAVGLTFPNALRSFLRQDPDVIMIGEIRDEKTAQIAIRASLTGHLVLATIHTNSAWGTITRLSDMGIEPFLIAETLKISVAQRLIRLLCTECKKKSKTPHSFLKSIKEYYLPVGCPQCHFTGYKGRTAVYEMIPIDDMIRSFIRKDMHAFNNEYRKKHKFESIKDKAMAAIERGITSVDEAYPLLNN